MAEKLVIGVIVLAAAALLARRMLAFRKGAAPQCDSCSACTCPSMSQTPKTAKGTQVDASDEEDTV